MQTADEMWIVWPVSRPPKCTDILCPKHCLKSLRQPSSKLSELAILPRNHQKCTNTKPNPTPANKKYPPPPKYPQTQYPLTHTQTHTDTDIDTDTDTHTHTNTHTQWHWRYHQTWDHTARRRGRPQPPRRSCSGEHSRYRSPCRGSCPACEPACHPLTRSSCSCQTTLSGSCSTRQTDR